MAIVGILPSYLDQKEIHPSEPLSFKLLLQGATKKNDEEENQILEYDSPSRDEESDESLPDWTRLHVMTVTFLLWNDRLIFSAEDFHRFGRCIRFNNRIVFS